jgi:alginate O-acetyltransferase complex protein AlgI
VVFNSLSFVVFFAAVLLLHNLPFSWQVRKFNLLIASYVFYAAWNPPFIVLLWISTIVDWWAARRIHAQRNQSRRRAWLLLSLGVNLGFLGSFKYGQFLLASWQAVMADVGVTWVPPAWNFVLPVGMAIYTLQSMSYTLDIYHRRAQPIRQLLDFALFVTFFTQLVAGPILRTSVLVPQLATARTASQDQVLRGLALMTLGMFEKVVLADGALAPTADAVFGTAQPLGLLDAWLGTIAFSGQIYCNFAGYCTMAMGAALCLGFSIPANFRWPYAAQGFADFWKRWNISLATWLRDYLYIPLGGNRRGPGRTCVNLLLTMLIGGLWYGASWTVVAWGGVHGLFLAGERFVREHRLQAWLRASLLTSAVQMLLTWTLITISWVLFRADGFPAAWRQLAAMFGANPDAAALLPTVYILETAVTVAGILALHARMRTRTLEQLVIRMPVWATGASWAAMMFAVVVTQGAGDGFSYLEV